MRNDPFRLLEDVSAGEIVFESFEKNFWIVLHLVVILSNLNELFWAFFGLRYRM